MRPCPKRSRVGTVAPTLVVALPGSLCRRIRCFFCGGCAVLRHGLRYKSFEDFLREPCQQGLVEESLELLFRERNGIGQDALQVPGAFAQAFDSRVAVSLFLLLQEFLFEIDKLFDFQFDIRDFSGNVLRIVWLLLSHIVFGNRETTRPPFGAGWRRKGSYAIWDADFCAAFFAAVRRADSRETLRRRSSLA